MPTEVSDGYVAMVVAQDVMEDSFCKAPSRERPEAAGFFRHEERMTVHIVAVEGAAAFRCGRLVSGPYEAMSSDEGWVSFPRCPTCFMETKAQADAAAGAAGDAAGSGA